MAGEIYERTQNKVMIELTKNLTKICDEGMK
jgi:hypothetical protein